MAAPRGRGRRCMMMDLAIGLELSPAATVDPYAITIPAPGLSLGAGRAAALIGKSYSAAGVHAAGMAPAIVGGAIDSA